MPRKPRIDIGGYIYHVINRGNDKSRIFKCDSDYELFEKLLLVAKRKFKMTIYSFELMPNHFHLVLQPKNNGDLGRFMHWLTFNFSQKYQLKYKKTGTGHLFQGRYKAFLVKDSKHLLQLFLYVERNAFKAKLVKKAENWKWSSLWIRLNDGILQKKLLEEWPIEIPEDYLAILNISIDMDLKPLDLNG